jgi:outer membrane lipoprotein-sorting protein
MITRRILLGLLGATALVPVGPALAANPVPLSQISAYLQRLGEAQARFTQINADGSRSTGTLYLKRPGRARFEYDPPTEVLVIVGGGTVAIFDDRGDASPESYPLRRTPLNVLLSRQVDLAGSENITGHRRDGAFTTVIARDPENPEYGTIALQFADNPLRLARWVIVGESGEQTTVDLGPLETPSGLSAFLFDINYEKRQRER